MWSAHIQWCNSTLELRPSDFYDLSDGRRSEKYSQASGFGR